MWWWQIYARNLPPERPTLPIDCSDLPRLHIACYVGFTQWVEDILTSRWRFVNPWNRFLNHRGKHPGTPLHCAVLSFNLETVEFLLKKGADPNCENNIAQTPFYYAILFRGKFRGQGNFLERWLACGADVDLMLRRAIYSRDMDLLELAIKHNARLNLPMKGARCGDSLTSLHRAVVGWESDQDSAIIRRLLKAGADPLIEDSNSRTASQYVYDPSMAGHSISLGLRREGVEEISPAIKGMFEEFGYDAA
jgi:hypothetical protein